MSAPKPRKGPHHGPTAKQFDALGRLATETAADLAAIKAALEVAGVLEFTGPAGAAQPQVAPSPRHLRLVPGGAA